MNTRKVFVLLTNSANLKCQGQLSTINSSCLWLLNVTIKLQTKSRNFTKLSKWLHIKFVKWIREKKLRNWGFSSVKQMFLYKKKKVIIIQKFYQIHGTKLIHFSVLILVVIIIMLQLKTTKMRTLVWIH